MIVERTAHHVMLDGRIGAVFTASSSSRRFVTVLPSGATHEVAVEEREGFDRAHGSDLPAEQPIKIQARLLRLLND